MSYDIDLEMDPSECPTCHRAFHGPDLPNPTYNLTAIFDLALTGEPLPNPSVSEGSIVIFKAETDRPRGLRVLSGRKAKDTVAQLRQACNDLGDPAKNTTFKALEPSNGWGTLGSALTVMQKLLDAAKEFPEGVWRIQ